MLPLLFAWSSFNEKQYKPQGKVNFFGDENNEGESRFGAKIVTTGFN